MNESITLFMRNIFSKALTIIFLALAAAITFSLFQHVVDGFINQSDFTEVLLKSINIGVIALAVFELALIINKEYSEPDDHHHKDAIKTLRGTLPRFIGTVCVALSLEGLIMVIKYSQLDLAGNLYYPVAIIISTAFLLISLGVFLRLTEKSTVGGNNEGQDDQSKKVEKK
ncbi:hypothetical protein OW492_02795 [Psychromonas sp. 14N.309.X.WAT.B.A12]|jgi:hypothetical protein|uniref:hypothetical protein n=1 Tax=Psychromonas sp. 14N.309.X.WAT.B.A12 TaxID=2998322 RepID=UPI0025B1815A|nr:hypothetical protein [Psychromonas sp. 14N.309.X.WAT.B.A12]MDN2662306.1 hypothetical protein [Psychromonas sp. 14N.309.X.WAT.B.A12]